MKKQKPRITVTILYKRRIAGGLTIPDFKFYYRAIIIKSAWNWHKNTQVDQWNKIENQEINPDTYRTCF